MAGQVMEAPTMHQPPMPSLAQLPGTTNCKNDHLITTTAATAAVSGFNTATTTAADMAYLQQLQAAAAEANGGSNNGGGGGARGEQCPRCASHDTKFCYYNNYNTSQPRHFCRACRRYWTLGGSLRNVPIGGSTRKRPRLAHYPPAARRPTPPPPAPAARYHIFGGGAAAPTMPPPPPPSSSSQGLLGSLFALGAAPLLEGRAGTTSTTPFDLGLAPPGAFGAGEAGMQMQGLGLRGGGPSPLLWPAGLLGIDGAEDTWKLPGAGAGATWPEFSAAAATPPQAGGLLQGGAQLM